MRYTRKAAYYTPGMSHSLIPENKEWKLYGTRVRKEDENMIVAPDKWICGHQRHDWAVNGL